MGQGGGGCVQEDEGKKEKQYNASQCNEREEGKEEYQS